jgi:serine/threonine-protein kinase
MRTTEVKVPDLSGRTLEEAGRSARDLGLVVEVVDERNDPGVSSGRVLQQEPPAGSAVRRGRKIKVVVSLGGRVISVPDLVGQGSRAAEIEIRRGGLQVGSEARVHRSRSVSGAVVAQGPPAGTPAVPGTRIHRLVSQGEEVPRWVMPDLRGRTRDAAERWIERWGFRRGAVRVVADTGRATGTVVGQLPLAGYPIAARGVVDLTVTR